MTSSGFSTIFNKNSNVKQSKDLQVCAELLETVENFKKHLTEQRKLREEIVNLSQQPLARVNEDLKSILQQTNEVSSGLQSLSARMSHLKDDALKEEKNVGIAQRTHETPLSLQFENNAPTEYFRDKLAEFDNKVRMYKQEVEVIEGLIASRSRGPLSPSELVDVLRKMDDQFVCLAAQLYTVQEDVKAAKSSYMRKYRSLFGGNRNPFAEVESSKSKNALLEVDDHGFTSLGLKAPKAIRTPYGPSPFTTTPTTVPVLNPAAGVQTLVPATGPASTLNPLASSNLFGNPTSTTATAGFGTLTAQNTRPGGFFGGLGTTPQVNMGLSSSASTSTNPSPFAFSATAPAGTAATGTGFSFGLPAASTTAAALGGGTSLFGQPVTGGAISLPFATTTASNTGFSTTPFKLGSTLSDGVLGKRFGT